MSKYISLLTFTVIVLAFLIASGVVFAAADDVTLTTDTVILVGGVNLNVSGSSAVVESIVVGADSFSVTLLATSSITVISNDRRTLTASVANSNYVKNTCGESSSSLELLANPDVSTVTISVTPSSSACSTAAAIGGGSSGGGSGGGGGGGGGGSTSSAVTTTTTTTTATPASTLGIAVGLSIEQAQSILNLLAAFETEQSIIDSVRDVLSGKSTPSASSLSVSGISAVFTVAFTKGQSNPDIKRLQQLLNSDPDTAVATSGVGSAGNETNYYGSLTEKAIQKFQLKYNIVSSGDPNTTGYGRLGPKTRAKLQEVFGN